FVISATCCGRCATSFAPNSARSEREPSRGHGLSEAFQSVAAAVIPRQARSSYAGHRHSARRLRVLVVDDEPAIAALLQDVLATLGGVESDVVRNGSEGLGLIRQHRYDLV